MEIAKSESEMQAWVVPLLSQACVHSTLVMELEELAKHLEKCLFGERGQKNLF